MFTRSEVVVLTNTQTHKQTPLKTSNVFATLRRSLINHSITHSPSLFDAPGTGIRGFKINKSIKRRFLCSSRELLVCKGYLWHGLTQGDGVWQDVRPTWVRIPKNVALGYDIGKISASCLVTH